MVILREEDPEIKVLQELYSMIVHVLRCPPPSVLPLPATYPPETPSSSSFRISPAAFASLFFGISVGLMLFGSVIFLVGFILMPWVVVLVLVLYFAGILSTFSGLGRVFLDWALSPHFLSMLQVLPGNAYEGCLAF